MKKISLYLLTSVLLFFCSKNEEIKSIDPQVIQTNVPKFKTVSAGDFHGVGIKEDGTLWN